MTKIREITVITCVRNQCQQFFAECANSVAKLPADVEWIITDDGSSNEAAKIYRRTVRDIAEDIPVEFITLPRRFGLSVARNAALEKASGNWIVVLDSDDRLTTRLSEILINLSTEIGLVAFESYFFNEKTSEHRRIIYFERLFKMFGNTVLDPFLWYDFYYHGIIARNQVLRNIGGYCDQLVVGEDQDILLRAIESLPNHQVQFIHEVGYEYRNNPDGVCSNEWKEVESNYTTTMLNAAKRRGAEFKGCRFGGVKTIDGAKVDFYEYLTSQGDWLSWEKYESLVGSE